MADQQVHSHWIATSGREGLAGRPDARFPYWSFTKTALAICALKFVEQGALALDQTIDDHPFTLRQLLQHTSGLPDYASLATYHEAVGAGEAPWPRDTLLEAALAQGMLFAPGDGWSYSNIGYMLVREMIEATANQPFDAVIADLITRPLGLQSVTHWQSQTQSASLHWDAAQAYDPGWVYHGCLIGTAQDAARLLHGLFAGRLIKSETLHMMLDRHPLGGAIAGRPWVECGYALGLMSGSVKGAGRAIGHSGAGPFSVNAVYHFPDCVDPITVASFTNGGREGVAEFAAAHIAETNL